MSLRYHLEQVRRKPVAEQLRQFRDKPLDYRLGQLRNVARRRIPNRRPPRWAFIYGLPRCGTTYLFWQFMRVSRAGASDWMMDEFALACDHARQRGRQPLDVDRLIRDLRANVVRSALIGGGRDFDLVVKQPGTTRREYDFWAEMLGGPPAYTLFLFREPDGWWASAREWFGYEERAAAEVYRRDASTFGEIGGVPLEYGEDLARFTATLPELARVAVEPFEMVRESPPRAPDELHTAFADLRGEIDSASA
jgi:hypothetical protein